MFPPGSNALLGVHCSLEVSEVGVGVDCTQEYGLELVHARVGKQEGWIGVGYEGRRRHEGVSTFFEVVDERIADLLRSPFWTSAHSGRHPFRREGDWR